MSETIEKPLRFKKQTIPLDKPGQLFKAALDDFYRLTKRGGLKGESRKFKPLMAVFISKRYDCTCNVCVAGAWLYLQASNRATKNALFLDFDAFWREAGLLGITGLKLIKQIRAINFLRAGCVQAAFEILEIGVAPPSKNYDMPLYHIHKIAFRHAAYKLANTLIKAGF